MSDEFQPDNWPEEYFENPPLEQIIGHGNDRGTIDVYRCEDGLVWHTTHEKCDYHGPTGPRTKANFRLTDVQEFAIAKDLASHFPSTQRRALLDHLLDTEGLPGVWEIEDLKRDLDNAESTIDRLVVDLKDTRATLQRQSESHADEVRLKRKYYQKTREQAKQTQRLEQLRQSRLHELLEAEARERVEVAELDEMFDLLVRMSFSAGGLEWCKLTLERNPYNSKQTPTWRINKHPRLPRNIGEVIDLALCCCAALAEKRRRESEVSGE